MGHPHLAAGDYPLADTVIAAPGCRFGEPIARNVESAIVPPRLIEFANINPNDSIAWNFPLLDPSDQMRRHAPTLNRPLRFSKPATGIGNRPVPTGRKEHIARNYPLTAFTA